MPPPTGGTNLITAISELTRSGKANTAKVLAEATGGAELSFARQRALERAIQEFGEELHSQYLISFAVKCAADETPHELRVRIKGHPELRLRYQQGY